MRFNYFTKDHGIWTQKWSEAPKYKIHGPSSALMRKILIYYPKNIALLKTLILQRQGRNTVEFVRIISRYKKELLKYQLANIDGNRPVTWHVRQRNC